MTWPLNFVESLPTPFLFKRKMLPLSYSVLFLASLVFAFLSFVGPFRGLPLWIRIALIMIGLSFFCGATLGLLLNSLAPRISPEMYSLLYSHKMIIFGIGIGVFLLLLFTGEYFKALRQLDNAERKGAALDDDENDDDERGNTIDQDN